MSDYFEQQFPNFYCLLVCYAGEESSDSSVVLSDYFSRYEKKYISLCIIELRNVLSEKQFRWQEIRELTNLLPPGRGGNAAEAEYRAWMEDVLRQLEERVAKMEDDSV